MTEIRIHGRGGQGNVIAAYILAQAAFESGSFAQAFPSFGPERRGAPVAAFVRIANQPLRRRCQVRNPAFLIIQDDRLLHVPGITDGLLPKGGILINSNKGSDDFALSIDGNVIAVPATALASQILGKPVPNTALLAAFAALTGLLPLEALEKAVAHRFTGETLERNLRLMRRAADSVPASLWKGPSDAPGN